MQLADSAAHKAAMLRFADVLPVQTIATLPYVTAKKCEECLPMEFFPTVYPLCRVFNSNAR